MFSDKIEIADIYNATKSIKIGRIWEKYLFDTTSVTAIKEEPLKHLKKTEFSNVSDEKTFKEAFFKMLHLLKAKATLGDYLDLNRRYMRTTDTILFEDGHVKLDVVPKQFFNSVIDKLYESTYQKSDVLFDDCSMEEIADCLVVKEEAIINGINKDFGINVSSISEAYEAVEDERYQRLKQLIDYKFTDEKLVELLNLFEKRNDSEIESMVTDNADIPTIFEYVLGIIWYKISEQKGKVLDYMKLSLDADLLPKTHAVGGEADIVYEYEETKCYPKHTMLLEATLADGTNQRRMEMEPVSRYLGQHLLKTGNLNSYCVFVTTFLNINVMSDFRGRKNIPYYDTNDYSKYVDGMKIIPLGTNELKEIVLKSIKYKDLYDLFESAFSSDMKQHEWYTTFIVERLKN